MSQGQNGFIPRRGQQDLIKYLPQIKPGDQLSVQWPTGYGKSMGFALAWTHCHRNGIANRLLIIVANDTQREQIKNDFSGDCSLVGAPCEGGVWAFDRSAGDLRAAKLKTAEVFVCTVQQLDCSIRGGLNTLKDLLTTEGTSWMVGFDEYHHYGQGMSWGESAKLAIDLSAFSMAMSATPYRRGVDTIFKQPELVVTYAKAVEERAVKDIVCFAHEYAVTVVDAAGDVYNYKTSELMEQVRRESEGDTSENLSAWEERRNIRYSPQYIHPLIINAVDRLTTKRQQQTEWNRLQMLIRAMSCSHAQMVCSQVNVLAPDLGVEWIGTGHNGRTDQENRDIIKRFCPPKKKGTRPQPELDVLVQVSMAGEGFDSINVCEIIDLFPVSIAALGGRATQDKQFYGRGSRTVNGYTGPLHVNIPSDHPLHVWSDHSLVSWMDSAGETVDPPEKKEDPTPPSDIDWEFPELPKMREVEWLGVIHDMDHFNEVAKVACPMRGWDMENPTDMAEFEKVYRAVMMKDMQQQAAQARSFQVKDYVDSIVGKIALVMAKRTKEINGSIIGRFKKETNSLIKRTFGKSRDEMQPDELERVATWLHSYYKNMRELI